MTAVPSGALPELLVRVIPWVPRSFALSVLWVAQVCAGGVVLGLAPAMAVLADAVRRTLDDVDAPLDLRGCWRLWRAELWRSQLALGVPALQLLPLAFYLQLTRGSVLVGGVAVLGAAYGVWLLHLPAVYARRLDGVGPAQLWLVNLRLMAGGVSTYLLAGAVVGIGGWALVVYVPVAALVFGPAALALAATLSVRRVVARATGRTV